MSDNSSSASRAIASNLHFSTSRAHHSKLSRAGEFESRKLVGSHIAGGKSPLQLHLAGDTNMHSHAQMHAQKRKNTNSRTPKDAFMRVGVDVFTDTPSRICCLHTLFSNIAKHAHIPAHAPGGQRKTADTNIC